MLPDTPLYAGWHSTDNEQPVPVPAWPAGRRQGVSTAPAAQPPTDIDIRGPGADIRHVAIEGHAGSAMPNPRTMRLAAFTGIAIVLAGTAFYFGVVNLRGALTEESTAATITITADGHFTPNAVTVHPGESVTIENANKDPQVLKSKDGHDLFPVQVIFTTPFTFTVPSDAQGAYVYFSETLPDDRTLTFTVEAATDASSASSNGTPAETAETPPVVTAPASSSTVDIPPLPFGAPQQAAASSSSASTAALVEQSNETATISLKDVSASTSSSASPTFDSNAIPTNPYTVGTQAEQPISTQIADTAKQTQELHSGAPVRELRQHTPRSVTSTGPAGMVLVFLPALFAVAFVFRRMTHEL